MTELPTTPAETTIPPAHTRSRRRLIIGIAVGLVAALVVFVGIQFALKALNANATVLYTSVAEHYSVMAPGKPAHHHETSGGMIPTTVTRWTDGERYYSVTSTTVVDVPPSQRGFFLNALLVGALKDAPRVSASSLKSSAVTQAFLATPTKITLSGAVAVRTTLNVRGAPAPFRIIITGHGGRFFMLVFSDSGDSRDNHFIKSFAFLS